MEGEIQIKAQFNWQYRSFKLPISGMEDYETLKIFIKSVFNLDDDVSFLIEYSKENDFYVISSQEDLWDAIDKNIGKDYLSLYITEIEDNFEEHPNQSTTEESNIEESVEPVQPTNEEVNVQESVESTQPINEEVNAQESVVSTQPINEIGNDEESIRYSQLNNEPIHVEESVKENESEKKKEENNSINNDNIIKCDEQISENKSNVESVLPIGDASSSKGKETESSEINNASSSSNGKVMLDKYVQTEDKEFENMKIQDLFKKSINLQTDAYKKIIQNLKNNKKDDGDVAKNIIKFITNECRNQYPNEINQIKQNIRKTTEYINNDVQDTLSKINGVIDEYSKFKKIFLGDIMDQLDNRSNIISSSSSPHQSSENSNNQQGNLSSNNEFTEKPNEQVNNQFNSQSIGQSSSQPTDQSINQTVNHDLPQNENQKDETIECVKDFFNNLALEIKLGVTTFLDYIDENDEKITNFILGPEYTDSIMVGNNSNNNNNDNNNTNNNNNNAENQSVTTNANVNSETEKLESQINDSNNKKENTVVKTENKNDNNNKLEETSSTENKAQENTRALSEKDHGDNNYEKPIIVGRNQTKYSNNYYIEQFNKYKEEYSRKKLEEQKMNNAEKPKENQEALKNEQPSYDIEDVKTSETEQASTSTRNLSIENENEVVNEHKEDNKKVNNFQSYSRTILNTLKDGITGLATSSKFVDDVFSAQPLEIIEDTNLQQHSNENIQEKEQKVQKEQKEQNEVIVEKEEKKDKGKEEEKEEKKQNEQSIQNQINEKKDEKEQEEEEEEEEEVLEEGPLIEMKEVEPEELVQSGDIVDFSHSPSKRQIEAVKALDAENDNENLPKIEMNEVNVNEYIKNGEIEEFSNGIINYEDIKDVEQKYPPNLDQEQNKLKVPSDELSQVISEDSFDYHKYSPTKLEESSNLSESRSLNVSEELELLRAEMTFEGDPTPNFKKRTSLHKKSPPTPDNSSGENEEALNSNEDKNGKYKKIQKEIFEQEYKKVEEDSVSEELKDLMEEELIKLDETGEESVYDNKVQGKPVDSKSRTNSDDFELLEFNVNDNPKIERQTKQKRTDEELLNEYEII
ncbi:hypothetical protein H8356DRAFT_1293632 [Neocallimastix lanati (nom. inval.)]|jgi:hypothetical protein|nr:hypothetical protein H8356DRAFT_1293632 [Neocallimastix sp. JGI-2020a]